MSDAQVKMSDAQRQGLKDFFQTTSIEEHCKSKLFIVFFSINVLSPIPSLKSSAPSLTILANDFQKLYFLFYRPNSKYRAMYSGLE